MSVLPTFVLGKIGISIHQDIVLLCGSLEYVKNLVKVNKFLSLSVLNDNLTKTMISNDYGEQYFEKMSHIQLYSYHY